MLRVRIWSLPLLIAALSPGLATAAPDTPGQDKPTSQPLVLLQSGGFTADQVHEWAAQEYTNTQSELLIKHPLTPEMHSSVYGKNVLSVEIDRRMRTLQDRGLRLPYVERGGSLFVPIPDGIEYQIVNISEAHGCLMAVLRPSKVGDLEKAISKALPGNDRWLETTLDVAMPNDTADLPAFAKGSVIVSHDWFLEFQCRENYANARFGTAFRSDADYWAVYKATYAGRIAASTLEESRRRADAEERNQRVEQERAKRKEQEDREKKGEEEKQQRQAQIEQAVLIALNDIKARAQNPQSELVRLYGVTIEELSRVRSSELTSVQRNEAVAILWDRALPLKHKASDDVRALFFPYPNDLRFEVVNVVDTTRKGVSQGAEVILRMAKTEISSEVCSGLNKACQFLPTASLRLSVPPSATDVRDTHKGTALTSRDWITVVSVSRRKSMKVEIVVRSDAEYKAIMHSLETATVTEGAAPQSERCPACVGSGLCRRCRGTGHLSVRNGPGYDDWNKATHIENCQYCDGNGRCTSCKGTGFVTQ